MIINEVISGQYRFHASGASVPHMGGEQIRRIMSSYHSKQQSGVTDGMTFLVNLSNDDYRKLYQQMEELLGDPTRVKMWSLDRVNS